VTEWLQQLGLDLHPAKTRIAHTLLPEDGKAGFDFLGFEVRQYPVSRYNAKRGYKTLIKPSRTAVKRHYAQLGAIIRKNQAARQEILIEQLNPLVVGWSRYYSAVVSKAIFQCLDNLLYLRLARWARYRHPHKDDGGLLGNTGALRRALGGALARRMGSSSLNTQPCPSSGIAK